MKFNTKDFFPDEMGKLEKTTARPADNISVSYVEHPYVYGKTEPFHRLTIGNQYLDIADSKMGKFLNLFNLTLVKDTDIWRYFDEYVLGR